MVRCMLDSIEFFFWNYLQSAYGKICNISLCIFTTIETLQNSFESCAGAMCFEAEDSRFDPWHRATRAVSNQDAGSTTPRIAAHDPSGSMARSLADRAARALTNQNADPPPHGSRPHDPCASAETVSSPSTTPRSNAPNHLRAQNQNSPPLQDQNFRSLAPTGRL
jgi:hypothetical protein